MNIITIYKYDNMNISALDTIDAALVPINIAGFPRLHCMCPCISSLGEKKDRSDCAWASACPGKASAKNIVVIVVIGRLVVEPTPLKNITPPKINMEPENGPLEKEIPIGNHHFQVPC